MAKTEPESENKFFFLTPANNYIFHMCFSFMVLYNKKDYAQRERLA